MSDIDLLMVAPYVPDFDRQSGSLRFFQILQMLAGRYRLAFLGCLEFEGHPSRRYVDALRDLGIAVYGAPEVDIGELLGRVRLGVFFEYYGSAVRRLLRVRLLRPDLRIVVDSVDIHYLRELRGVEFARRPTSAKRRALKTMRRELGVYREADLVLTVTEEDRRELVHRLPNAMVAVVPNVHRVRVGSPDAPMRESNSMLFVGAFTHAPNVDAMVFFCDEILPLIRRRLGHLKVTIVGHTPPPEVTRFASDDVQITGWVPDVDPYLDSHRLVIAPLRFGAGMKGKIGQALAAGIPVVTTSVGAEGMGLENWQTAVIADSARDFAEAVVRVCSDSKLHARLSAGGQAHVREHWDFTVVERQIASLFEKVEGMIPRRLSWDKDVVAAMCQAFDRSRVEWKMRRLGSIAEWYFGKLKGIGNRRR